jgi:hypothetical protein
VATQLMLNSSNGNKIITVVSEDDTCENLVINEEH